MESVDLRSQLARIRADVERRMSRVLDHGQFVLGPEVAELERQLAGAVGRRHCLAMASGTDSLLAALMALGVGHGDEVITTPFTFVATVEAVRLTGATPVFCDIRPDTYTLDPVHVRSRITARTRAIVAVDLYGQCADYEALHAVADARGIPVVSDAAQSFGATARGRKACSFGVVATTSFYPSKPLGCYGDGGAAFTDDDGLAGAMREIRVHGQRAYGDCARVGINGRLDTLQCAILLAKLDIFDEELARRQEVAARYGRLLSGIVRTPVIAPGNTSAWAQYTIEVDDRDRVRDRLRDAGVPASVHYPCALHQVGPYREAVELPVAERAAQRVLSLPMHPYLDEADQARVADALAQALR